MKDKLPKIYANKIEKEIKNNEKIYNSNRDNSKNNPEKKENNTPETINQKINRILNSKNYIYKVPVKVTTKDNEEIRIKMIGKNKKQIITIDNKLIDIDQIKNIEIDKEKNE